MHNSRPIYWAFDDEPATDREFTAHYDRAESPGEPGVGKADEPLRR
jgi:hypothetical protein